MTTSDNVTHVMSKRISARVDKKLKDRVEKITAAGILDESTLVRIALQKFLPEIEAGKLDLRALQKQAA